MANRYYGIDKGESGIGNVTEGSSSTATTDVEIRVDTGLSKAEALILIQQLTHAIFQDTWPPA